MKLEELFEVLGPASRRAQPAFKTYEHWFIHMEEYKEQLKKQAADRDAQRQGVSLMTMHSAKGLEFRVVYILDANEGVTPHHKAVLIRMWRKNAECSMWLLTRAKERLPYLLCEGAVPARNRHIKVC